MQQQKHKPMDLESAMRTLRLDADPETEQIISELLAAVPGYIESTTGMSTEEQKGCPLCNTVTGFLLRLWYYPEQADSEKLQRVSDSLLKTITTMVKNEGN